MLCAKFLAGLQEKEVWKAQGHLMTFISDAPQKLQNPTNA